MKKIRKLRWEELKHSYLPSDFSFKTTDELKYLDEIIGQERAKKAINFGLTVKVPGYNIYMLGEPGTGKTTFAKMYTQQFASQKQIPGDWCYVYNFRQRRSPKALRFEPGDGKKFRDDMNELIEFLTKEIPNIYSSKEYEKQRNNIISEYQSEKELCLSQLKNCGRHMGFIVNILRDAISLTPIKDDGSPMNEIEFEGLDEREKVIIEEQSKKLQEIAEDALNHIKDIDQKINRDIEDLEYEIGLKGVGYYIKILKERYYGYEEVEQYLEDVLQDLLDNIQVFINEQDDQQEKIINLLPWVAQNNIRELVNKYRVNLLIDHSTSKVAPVILDFNTTYSKLLGELEYDNEFGTLSTDFMKIKPGLFHKANGGYLILQAESVLSNYETWTAIKQVLKTNQVYIENPQGMSVIAVASLKPEPIPVDIKVILIGSQRVYNLLYEYDPEFRKLFKVRADFDKEMQNNNENAKLIARFIRTYCDKEFLLPFSAGAVSKVIEYASRYVENQKKITTQFSIISEILIEASTFANMDKQDMVSKKYVEKAIQEKEYRASYYEEKLDEQIINGKIMIETTGEKTGQINGLAVYDIGDYRFGKPIKITATTYKGQAGIINIEKEAKLSGAIHTKGTQVIVGCLGQMYAQQFPLSLSCRICIEQNYGGIDGDSASSAELYAVLSSLADIPIKQNIAVTGSINQHGDIQAIGGVTHKIEGFFRLCKNIGLTGEQGVIIPTQNISDLVLKEDVITAVKKGEFHIYAISNIEEGIEILTGIDYELIQKKVFEKLKKFYQKTKNVKDIKS